MKLTYYHTPGLTIRPDVWASWWSADAVAESPARSTAYWIGLYALLNTLPLLVVGLWVG